MLLLKSLTGLTYDAVFKLLNRSKPPGNSLQTFIAKSVKPS